MTSFKDSNHVMHFFTRAMLAIALPGAAVAAFTAADDARATALIVRSSGPSSTAYKPGKALPDNARLALRPGDMLVVLATDSTRTFHGPGTFALASAGNEPATVAGRRGRFSAIRTAGIVPRSPTLWHVDVSQSGKMCLADQKNVTLWRGDAAQDATLKITKAGGATESVTWPTGQSTLAWPAGMAIASGTDYEISVSGQATPSHMTFSTLPSLPTDLTSVAQALIDQKCENQLDLLIGTLPTKNPRG